MADNNLSQRKYCIKILERLKKKLENEGFETLIVGEELAVGKIISQQGTVKNIDFAYGISRDTSGYSVRYVSSNISPPREFNNDKEIIDFLKKELI